MYIVDVSYNVAKDTHGSFAVILLLLKPGYSKIVWVVKMSPATSNCVQVIWANDHNMKTLLSKWDDWRMILTMSRICNRLGRHVFLSSMVTHDQKIPYKTLGTTKKTHTYPKMCYDICQKQDRLLISGVASL